MLSQVCCGMLGKEYGLANQVLRSIVGKEVGQLNELYDGNQRFNHGKRKKEISMVDILMETCTEEVPCRSMLQLAL